MIIKYLSLLLFINLSWGQDILLTIDKKEFKGKYLEQSDKNTKFLPDGQKTPQIIPNRLIKSIYLESNEIIDFDNDFLISELEKKKVLSSNSEPNHYIQFDTKKSKPIDGKKISISLGFGGNRLMSLISITKDIKVKDDFGIFFGGGWSVPFLGIGAYFQPNYNKTGFNGSLALGPSFSLLNTELSINLNYQVQLSKSGFISVGLSTGFIERSNFYSDPTCCDNYILPALSYHFRL